MAQNDIAASGAPSERVRRLLKEDAAASGQSAEIASLAAQLQVK